MSIDNQDIQQLNNELARKYPDILCLPIKSKKHLVDSVIGVINRTYPRYDKHTLVELVEILDDYVDTVVYDFLCNYHYDPRDSEDSEASEKNK
jgi:hypothetical protein